MDLTYVPATKELRDRLDELELNVLSRVIDLADAVANDVVNYAKSTGSKTVPGASRNSAGNYISTSSRTSRKPHPGGWADITGALANSIQYSLETNGLEVKAIVEATMEYAAALDAKTGYDVLGGIEEVARKSIKKHAKNIFEL